MEGFFATLAFQYLAILLMIYFAIGGVLLYFIYMIPLAVFSAITGIKVSIDNLFLTAAVLVVPGIVYSAIIAIVYKRARNRSSRKFNESRE